MVALNQGKAVKMPFPRDSAGAVRVCPMSFAQQRLWMLDQLLPLGPVYNFTKVVRLKGALDVEALRGALNEIVRRHEVLRTRFTMHDGQPVQVIEPELTLPLDLVDLSVLPDGEREVEARRESRNDARMTFTLNRGPLLRLRLLRLAKDEHWMVRTMNHLVTDGWSMGVFWRELSALYGAFARGDPSPLPKLALQYADYAAWQRELLQGEVLRQQLEYWKRTLVDPPVLELPTDHPRPAIASYRGASLTFELGAELTRSLRALSRQEGATLFTTLLAALQVLLYRYTGQDDLTVGVPVAGRRRADTESLIGFFVNTLVIRADLSGAPTFSEYLGRVRARVREAYAHQDVPFEKLVEVLHVKRDLSRNPLFQVCFTKQFPESQEMRLVGLETIVSATGNDTARFDLEFSLVEMNGNMHVAVDYATDLFDAATIERLTGNWQTLLEGIVADPGQAISRLPLHTPKERQQLLVEWNATAVDYPCDKCVHPLFEQQVERTPEAVAVVFGEDKLTYRELNTRANRLAHHLRTLGVGPEVLVGICFERSLELVIALLGTLKAGGAYVPLDPAYPAQRLAFMLADAAVPVLLTQRPWHDNLPPTGAALVCLDAPPPELEQQPIDNPKSLTRPDHLAYVIYTSGSTGTPKGVMVEHRMLCNCLLWMGHHYPLGPSDRVLQSTSMSFDMSIVELFAPLMAGAQLVMAAPGAHRAADELCDVVRRQRITVLQVVPGMLAAIVDRQDLPQLESLRRVFTAGEALGAGLARQFHAQSAAELVNGYGPTETFYSTFWTCRRDDTRHLVPIGYPIGNSAAYVLDAQMQPTPVGVPGELYFGGAVVARGYLNRDDLTAERFIPDPFAGKPDARLYRTGDRARYLDDRTLEYLGRGDRQVKIRGFRIEPGEIEAVLARQPQVREVVVALREDTPGDPRLVAYVTARDAAVATADLRAYARQRLPEYMLPAAFVLLPALPLTPNGKVDRGALPAPAYEGSEPGHAPPRTPTEQALAKAMAEVLNLDRVGLDDNFFDLGGHSLLAVRLMNRIRHDLNIHLSLRQLFETPTVGGLALAAAHGPARGTTDLPLSPRA